MKEKKWKPKENEKFYYADIVNYGVWKGHNVKDWSKGEYFVRSGNCFRTKSEAQKKLSALKSILKN